MSSAVKEALARTPLTYTYSVSEQVANEFAAV